MNYLFLALGQIAIGCAFVVSKKLMLLGIVPELQLLCRFVISSLLLLLVSFIYIYRNPQEKLIYSSLNIRDISYIFLQSLCAGLLFNIFALEGMRYISATVAGIVASILPVTISILAYFILREKLGRNNYIALSLAVLGIIVLHLDTIGTGNSSNLILGILLVMLATVPEGMYTILSKLLSNKLHIILHLIIINLLNVLLTGAYFYCFYDSVPKMLSNLDFNVWMWILLAGLCSFSFYSFWTKGVMGVKANTAALFACVMPVATSVIAILFLDESLSLYDITGMMMVTASIFIGIRDEGNAARSSG